MWTGFLHGLGLPRCGGDQAPATGLSAGAGPSRTRHWPGTRGGSGGRELARLKPKGWDSRPG